MQGDSIVAAARSMLGTPYVHGGRLPGAGLDCAGLAAAVAGRLGYALWDEAGYSAKPDGKLYERIARNGTEVGTNDLKSGDVLVFWLDPRTKLSQHVGVLTESGTMIHVEMGVGRVVEVTFDDRWRRRLIGAVRWRP